MWNTVSKALLKWKQITSAALTSPKDSIVLSPRQSGWLDMIYSSSFLMMSFRFGFPSLHEFYFFSLVNCSVDF